jgi:hypothetical protein
MHIVIETHILRNEVLESRMILDVSSLRPSTIPSSSVHPRLLLEIRSFHPLQYSIKALSSTVARPPSTYSFSLVSYLSLLLLPLSYLLEPVHKLLSFPRTNPEQIHHSEHVYKPFNLFLQKRFGFPGQGDQKSRQNAGRGHQSKDQAPLQHEGEEWYVDILSHYAASAHSFQSPLSIFMMSIFRI